MFELASLQPGETVVDLGSGDGRIVIAAARDFHARAFGVERRKRLVEESRRKIKDMGLIGRAKIVEGTFRKTSLKGVDVVATYLSGYTLGLLVPIFERDLKPGARVVNFDFPILEWKPTKEIELVPKGWRKPHSMYLYEMPAAVR
ncbi:MAG TPA: methyltransferase domain-containing protein [Nitrososphaerales archaeon]|nr:methyltransferase domain-containing protein [Nitrososphaerales archaeon]